MRSVLTWANGRIDRIGEEQEFRHCGLGDIGKVRGDLVDVIAMGLIFDQKDKLIL